MKGNEYNDLWVILENMDRSEAELLPEKFRDFVRDSMIPGAGASVRTDVSLGLQVLPEKTKSLLASLALTYWSKGILDRREVAGALDRNEKRQTGRELTPMTEEEYQDILMSFDDWDDYFGPIPHWAESRGWKPAVVYEITGNEVEAELRVGDLLLKQIHVTPVERKRIREEAEEWVLVAETKYEEELHWHDDDYSEWTNTRTREDYYEKNAILKDGHFHGVFLKTVHHTGMGMAEYRNEENGVVCIDGSHFGRVEEYEYRSSDESSTSEKTTYFLQKKEG